MTLTTTEVFTYDGVALNTMGYNISTGTGRLITPELRGSSMEVAARSGTIFRSDRVTGPGEVILTMWVSGHDVNDIVPGGSTMRREFHKNQEALLKLFAYNKLCYVTAVQADGTTRECFAYVAERMEWTTTSGRTRADFAVALELPNVYWQDTSDTTFTQTVASSPGTLNLTSFAAMTGVIEDAVIEVRGPAASGVRVTNPTTGIYVQLNRVLSAAETWQINLATWASLVLPSTNVTTQTIHWGHSKFVVVPPGSPPSLVLSGASFTSNTQLKLVGRAKYLVG